MINTLHINNFQSHKTSTLEFSEGVNIITGASDSGKSAIIRALRFCIWNKPTGDFFRSTWGGDTTVELELDTADIVLRGKTKEGNLYKLNDTVFKAFKSEVPAEIQKALNFNEINLQQQLDKPFLLSDTPGQVAKFFNKIVNMEKIDLSISQIRNWFHRLNASIELKTELFTAKQTELNSFDYIDKLEIEVENIENLDKEKETKLTQLSRLTTLIDKYTHIDASIDSYSELFEIEKKVDAILALVKEKEETESAYKFIDILITKYNSRQERIDKYNSLIKCEGLVDNILELNKGKVQVESQQESLNKLIKQYTLKNSSLISNQRILSELETKLEKNMPKQCPLCETILK